MTSFRGSIRPVALEARIDADLQLGRHAELIPGLLAEHLTAERPAVQLITALYRACRGADALEAYQRTASS